VALTGPGAKQKASMPDDCIADAVVFMILRTRTSDAPAFESRDSTVATKTWARSLSRAAPECNGAFGRVAQGGRGARARPFAGRNSRLYTGYVAPYRDC
jgi:hypothetical protein